MTQQENQVFQRQYEQHFATVWRTCSVLLRDRAETEDAVSAVFLKLLEKRRNFASPEHEKAYLIRMARNHCLNELKRHHRKGVSLDTVAEVAAPAESHDLVDLIATLPPQDRLVLYLFYYEGLSGQEIARQLGKKAATVRSCLSRARDRLKKTWEEAQ